MKCEDARALVAIDVFGTLDASSRLKLDEHVRACPACARIAEKAASLREAFEVPDDLPQPNWERSWSAIADRAFARPARRWRFGFFNGWVLAAASLVAVFVLGLLAGRRLPEPRPAVTASVPTAPTSIAEPSPLRRYADTVEPVLAEFAGRGAAPLPPAATEARRRLLRSMIEETVTLRRLAAQAGDGDLEALLDELEPLLVSMVHLQPGDRDSADLLTRVIREHDIRSKVRDLARTNPAS